MTGLTDSPYHVCQLVMWDKIISVGDQIDSNNTFSWQKEVLNLPRTEEYDCQLPWVFKQGG